jgi:hypothetical protein
MCFCEKQLAFCKRQANMGINASRGIAWKTYERCRPEPAHGDFEDFLASFFRA